MILEILYISCFSVLNGQRGKKWVKTVSAKNRARVEESGRRVAALYYFWRQTPWATGIVLVSNGKAAGGERAWFRTARTVSRRFAAKTGDRSESLHCSEAGHWPAPAAPADRREPTRGRNSFPWELSIVQLKTAKEHILKFLLEVQNLTLLLLCKVSHWTCKVVAEMTGRNQTTSNLAPVRERGKGSKRSPSRSKLKLLSGSTGIQLWRKQGRKKKRVTSSAPWEMMGKCVQWQQGLWVPSFLALLLHSLWDRRVSTGNPSLPLLEA